MKRIYLLILLTLLSAITWAQEPQCKIEIANEMHLKNQSVSVYQQQQPKVVIDQNNDVYINGDKLDLSDIQRKAVASYREKIRTYIPKAKKIANDGIELADNAIDDIGDSFNSKGSFGNVKKAVADFYANIEARYYNDGEWVLKKDAVAQALKNWQQDSSAAMERFNGEFFSSGFNVLSQKMQLQGGVNLTELQQQMIEMKARLESKLKNNSQQLQQQVNQYCDDLKGLATEEKQLHQQVPQLQSYPVFVI